ncbi:MAG: hypothetical protein IKJ94_02965, partial [Oscillospiraceae bacterium]|nr:hypothetical protein [Oscillospiraceae bacterium]
MKRTLSLLVALVMVISMVPNVFAADDSVDFDDLIYLETYSPLTVNIEAGATEPVEFLWVPTEEGTLTYDINNADTTVSIVLAQGENTATSEAGVVALNVVAGEEVSIKISDTTGAAVENLVINGTFGKVCVHEAGEAVQENVVDATCTEAGSYDSVVYCTLCGEKLSTTAVVVEALGHSWDEGVYHEATTTANAYTLYTCTVCGETKIEEEEGTQLPENVITKQPVNDVKAKGKIATFTVEATGDVTYQWQRIKSGATVWTNITGATSASYSVTVSDATIIPYRCVVTIANGTEYISNEVTIIEPDPLVTVLNEGGNLHVIKNTVVSFHVELDSVEGVTFQWQREKIAGRWFNV